MSRTSLSLLEFGLLGLVHDREPCCGYDLRKVFADTPMGSFSDSPGSIYPALARLERAKLIRGHIETTSSVRRRKLFRLTSHGRRALKQWLRQPITQADMIRGMPELALRFAFLESVLGRSSCVPFLQALEKELAFYVPTLRQHLDIQRATNSVSASLALEGGVMGYESRLAWARRALVRLKRKPTRHRAS
jgi:DNA-binding PadR family transcriptional regulator